MDKSVKYIIRHIKPEETILLKDFLYEAIYIPEGIKPPSRDIVFLPELKIYFEDFGTKKDDCCLVAEHEGKVIGAVWTRIMNDYGHVDDETPSLSISLYKEYRNKGIGSRLMRKIIKELKSNGYNKVSLSVQKENYATEMYLKLGFKVVKETIEEFIMIKDLTKETDYTCKTAEQKEKQYKIRQLEENDIPEMQELFRSTVLNVNTRHYTKEEAEDWASCGNNAEHWKELISSNNFIGAFDGQNRMIGFSSMNRHGHLHSMFVHKDWQNKGVATQLLSEVERIARQYGVKEITSEVSITAKPFFEKNGYQVMKEQKQKANRLELTNFAMYKLLQFEEQ